MTDVRTLTLLRVTITETHEYDHDQVLMFAAHNGIGYAEQDDDDRIIETYMQTTGSTLGDELFGSLADQDSGVELFTRMEDE